MDELKNPEEQNDAEKSAEGAFVKAWTEAWERLEERTRRRPGFHLFLALIVGYFLQLFPFDATCTPAGLRFSADKTFE
jgi:hypothetical protein